MALTSLQCINPLNLYKRKKRLVDLDSNCKLVSREVTVLVDMIKDIKTGLLNYDKLIGDSHILLIDYDDSYVVPIKGVYFKLKYVSDTIEMYVPFDKSLLYQDLRRSLVKNLDANRLADTFGFFVVHSIDYYLETRCNIEKYITK